MRIVVSDFFPDFGGAQVGAFQKLAGPVDPHFGQVFNERLAGALLEDRAEIAWTYTNITGDHIQRKITVAVVFPDVFFGFPDQKTVAVTGIFIPQV